MAILFNVVQKSGNFDFENDNSPPIAFRTRAVSYALGPYKVLIESFVVKKDSFDWKLIGLVPFLLVKSDQRANVPSPRPSFPQTLSIKT
jgi:hypothetical protein